MNSNLRNIIIAGAVLVCLVVVMVILNQQENSESSEAEVTTTTVAAKKTLMEVYGKEFTADDVANIAVKNSEESYTIVPNESGVIIEEYKDLPFNTAIIDVIPQNAIGATILNTPEPKDLAEFGLANPRAEYTVNFKSGDKMTVKIGDTTPIESETYILLEEKIYTVSSYLVNPYLSTAKYYISPILVSTPADTADQKMYSVLIERSGKEDVFIDTRTDEYFEHEFSPYQFVLQKPGISKLSSTKAKPYIMGIYGLTANEVVSLDTDILSDDPISTITFQKDADGIIKYVLKIWNAPDTDTVNKHYVTLNDSGIVYGFAAEGAGADGSAVQKLPWLTIIPEDIISISVISELSIWDYKKLTVKTADTELEYNLNGSGEKETFTVNNGDVTIERFQELNSFLLNAYLDDGNFSPNIGELLTTITVTMSYGEVCKVEYYASKDNPLESFAYVNGNPTGSLRRAYVDILLENVKKMNGVEALVTKW